MPTNIGANSTEPPSNPQGKEVELHLDPEGTGSTEAADKDGLVTRRAVASGLLAHVTIAVLANEYGG
jgi:hypothetical protein